MNSGSKYGRTSVNIDCYHLRTSLSTLQQSHDQHITTIQNSVRKKFSNKKSSKKIKTPDDLQKQNHLNSTNTKISIYMEDRELEKYSNQLYAKLKFYLSEYEKNPECLNDYIELMESDAEKLLQSNLLKQQLFKKQEQRQLKLIQDIQYMNKKLKQQDIFEETITSNIHKFEIETIQNQKKAQEMYQKLNLIASECEAERLNLQNQKQKLKEAEKNDAENQIDIKNFGHIVFILASQLNKKLRCSFTTYSNYSLDLPFNYLQWDKKKTKSVSFIELRNYIISKLYPGMKQIFKKFVPQSPVYNLLFDGNNQECSYEKRQQLCTYLFEDVVQRIPKKTCENGKFFLAIGSKCRQLYKIIQTYIISELTEFKGFLIKIQDIRIQKVWQAPLIQTLVIKYTLEDKKLEKLIPMIDLGSNFDLSSIQLIISKQKNQSQLSSALTKNFGQFRNGYICVEIPSMMSLEEQQEYTKMFNLIKTVK